MTKNRVATNADVRKDTTNSSSDRLRELMSRGHDNWGPCCPGCPWWGEAYKPCASCNGEEARHG